MEYFRLLSSLRHPQPTHPCPSGALTFEDFLKGVWAYAAWEINGTVITSHHMIKYLVKKHEK